ncbi:hypothetical protein [Thioclava sp.]|uniref:hypothetical protein n=1 Tax=Thioclava sp. TaxID=1933450 RepID=UPI003AA9505C
MQNKTRVSELKTANLSVRDFELYAHTDDLLFLEAQLVFELAATRVQVVAKITITGENVSVHAERIQDEKGLPIVGEHLLAIVIANRREEISSGRLRRTTRQGCRRISRGNLQRRWPVR